MSRTTLRAPLPTDQAGFTLIGVLAILLPLIGLVAAAMMAMQGRSAGTRDTLQRERALLAAEAGLDQARQHGVLGTLAHGVTINRTLPGGASFTVLPTHLLVDGKDNDGDGDLDEDDEDVFELRTEGRAAGAVRRIVGYLSRGPGMPPIDSAMTLHRQSPQVQINFNGTGFITGIDTKMDGSPGPVPAVPGLSIMAPATIADLTANYAVDQQARITGAGAAPSLGQSNSTFDLNQLILDVQSGPDIVLDASYTGANWGTAPTGPFRKLYRNGDLSLYGTVTGTGVLLVTGKLQAYDDFRFDGLVVVLGDVQMDGNMLITGAFIQGPASNQTQFANNVRIRYSSEALAKALPGLGSGNFTVVTGWQEISRY